MPVLPEALARDVAMSRSRPRIATNSVAKDYFHQGTKFCKKDEGRGRDLLSRSPPPQSRRRRRAQQPGQRRLAAGPLIGGDGVFSDGRISLSRMTSGFSITWESFSGSKTGPSERSSFIDGRSRSGPTRSTPR